MSSFKGFPAGKLRQTPVPDQVFRELLPAIDHLGELKLTFYLFWRFNRMEGSFRYLRRADFLADRLWMQGMGATPAEAESALDEALQRAVARGTLLQVSLSVENDQEELYFLNSAKGRAAVKAILKGEWNPLRDKAQPALAEDFPNIFELYENHIGPLTPMIAEALREAEETYPSIWIQDAFRIAVENNARSWRYVEAVLKRWQVEGRDDRKDRQDAEKARRRYVEGEYADFIEH